MIIHWDVQQRTEAWHELKQLRFSGTSASTIITGRTGVDTVIHDLVLNRIRQQESKVAHLKDIQRGEELEPIARELYCLETKKDVREAGFVELSKHVGYSPDGLVFENNKFTGLIEIKCRADKEHLWILRTNFIDPLAMAQMQFGMFVCGVQWCDYINYNPNFKQALKIIRVSRDLVMFSKIRDGLENAVKRLEYVLNENAVRAEL